MTLDKIEHKELLLKMFDIMNFPGNLLEVALELKYAIQQADVKQEDLKEVNINRVVCVAS